MNEAFEYELKALAETLDEVLAGGLAQLNRQESWSPYELHGSLHDLRGLSRDEDACYDRPSSGWAYAAWYHGRRTRSAVQLLAPSLLGSRDRLRIVDLGAGSGATLWAITSIIAAARTSGIEVPQVRIFEVDSSAPMLTAAQELWKAVKRSPVLGPHAALVSARFHLRTWTDLHRLGSGRQERCLLVGSYLFDSSDRAQAAEVAELLARAADTVGATHVALVAGRQKRDLLTAAQRLLTADDWEEITGVDHLHVSWKGPLTAVADARATAYRGIPACCARPAAGAPEWRWSSEQPSFHRLRRASPTTELVPRTRRRGIPLDPAQDAAATPDNRLTAIVGAAGSGESRVLVERVVRTVLSRRPGDAPAKVLVTSFNKKMVAQLAAWLREQLDDPSLPRWTPSESGRDGDKRFTLTGPGATVDLMNWDKIPFHAGSIARALRHSGEPSALTPELLDHHLRTRGLDRSTLDSAEQRVLDPLFLEAELRRVIYGLGVWHSRDAYTEVPRVGRERPIGRRQRALVWDVAMDGRLETWSHRRIDSLEAARAASRDNPPPYTHLFLDECQDMTPADYELATLLVPDPNGIVVVGDEAQSLHLGRACRRPGQLAVPGSYRREGQPSARRWNNPPHNLTGSYRLPIRVCECVQPLAELIEYARAREGDAHDVTLPTPQKSAVLGTRPIVVSKRTAGTTVPVIVQTYRALIEAAPRGSRTVTIAEGRLDTGGMGSLKRLVGRLGGRVECESMRDIKGLERPCVIWPTDAPLPTDESELEWIYTILTRSTGLTIIVVDPEESRPAAREALDALDRGRLMLWDEDAEYALAAAATDPPESRPPSHAVPDRDAAAPRRDHAEPDDRADSGNAFTHSWVYNRTTTLTLDELSVIRRDRPGLLEKYPRYGSAWSEEEDDHLEMLNEQRLPLSRIAGLHRRDPGGVRARLIKLGLAPHLPDPDR